MKKKEMNYSGIDRNEVIADGIYKGMMYVVRNIGSHPCCYIQCPEETLERHRDDYGEFDGILVHGGMTFSGTLDELGLSGYAGKYVGWDYGHAGDWKGYYTDEDNIAYHHNKYTTDMLIQECKEAIYDLQELIEKDKRADTETVVAENLILDDGKIEDITREALDVVKKFDREAYMKILGREITRRRLYGKFQEEVNRAIG